jgi:hypothetical protein
MTTIDPSKTPSTPRPKPVRTPQAPGEERRAIDPSVRPSTSRPKPVRVPQRPREKLS